MALNMSWILAVVPGNSSPNSISFKKEEWYKVGGYKIPEDVTSVPAEDIKICNDLKDRDTLLEENDNNNIDFVYHYGGVNYHLSCIPHDTIDKIAYQQLVDMKLFGNSKQISHHGKLIFLNVLRFYSWVRVEIEFVVHVSQFLIWTHGEYIFIEELPKVIVCWDFLDEIAHVHRDISIVLHEYIPCNY